MRIGYLWFSVLLATLTFTDLSQAQGLETVTFGCDAVPGAKCHFDVRDKADGRVRAFALSSGERGTLGGVAPGVDTYTVSINRLPPDDPNNCGRTYWCKQAVVNRGYNN
ncbi:hypothetical protein [Trinickia acidisoli]|uniref:hypothetical protein n=1 Tax=Trinickia acidisoli TaxID=2767482 RepID=UPI001A8D24F0|nr:hypothetical protein [Trinickia acidisoli]